MVLGRGNKPANKIILKQLNCHNLKQSETTLISIIEFALVFGLGFLG